MTLSEFFSSLADMYAASLPQKSALLYMRRRLDSEGLSADKIQNLYDRICDTLQYHPVWESINAMVGELGYRAKRSSALVHWLAFDLRGSSWVMRCPDPANPRGAPTGATNVRLIVDRPITDEELQAARAEPVPYELPLPLSRPGESRQGHFLAAGDLVLDIIEDVSQSVSDRLSRVDTWDDI